jgi:4-hydroxy-3-polyprenylbenzoate decarboxylase
VRETPLHTGHLRTMTRLSEMGAVIAPTEPAFYMRPESLDDVVTQTVGRALDLFDLEHDQVKRWRGE